MGNLSQTAGPVTFTAGEAMAANRIVVLNTSNQAVYADQYERGFGVTTDAAASGAPVPVMPFAVGNTFPVIASAAYAVGTMVYGADDGKVTSTSGGFCYGPVVDASVAADLECSVSFGGNGATGIVPVIIKAASFTLTKHMSGAICNNLGASGTIVWTLPDTGGAGMRFTFVNSAAQAIQIEPGASNAFFWSGAKQADGKYLTADDEAESIQVVSDAANDYITFAPNGTWAVEG